jgi:hypothetical protein
MKKFVLMLCAIIALTSLACAVVYNECDCSKKVHDRAMKIGRNIFQMCNDQNESHVTFTHEPGPRRDIANSPHKEFYISGNEREYLVKEVAEGSCKSGAIFVRATLNELGDQLIITQNGKTYRAIVQPALSEASVNEKIRVYLLRIVARNCILPIANWNQICYNTNIEFRNPPNNIGVMLSLKPL